MNGIYEEKHGKFVIDLTDLNKTGPLVSWAAFTKKEKKTGISI